ncbi:MAG: protein kinase [Polyangiaceae bacterium]|nr:protein kinase [Myxococcales bacterium]MCB9584204.1 protein kinase [Polyangiaceae bacterium]MCB9608634.1 protein kinase [Polyangiaceae bacterium]
MSGQGSQAPKDRSQATPPSQATPSGGVDPQSGFHASIAPHANALQDPIRVGRYLLFDSFASGGMAQVHIGRLIGPVGFSRAVAIKRLHPHLAREARFVSMFVDEARLAGRVRHPNVVSVTDVVSAPGELLLVMDYVPSESISRIVHRLRQRGKQVPVHVAVGILVGTLEGLHGAHETLSDTGSELGLVHRDVSPQNILVGEDGLARVVDFGIAMAHDRVQVTATGQLKGKLEYMPREQLYKQAVDRRADVYAASVVLWELLTLRPLFRADHPNDLVKLVAQGALDPPSHFRSDIPPELDEVVMRGLSLDASDRFQSAREMAEALEHVTGVVPPREIQRWLQEVAGSALGRRAARVAQIEAYDIEADSWQPQSAAVGVLLNQAEHASRGAGTLDYAAERLSPQALTRVQAPELALASNPAESSRGTLPTAATGVGATAMTAATGLGSAVHTSATSVGTAAINPGAFPPGDTQSERVSLPPDRFSLPPGAVTAPIYRAPVRVGIAVAAVVFLVGGGVLWASLGGGDEAAAQLPSAQEPPAATAATDEPLSVDELPAAPVTAQAGVTARPSGSSTEVVELGDLPSEPSAKPKTSVHPATPRVQTSRPAAVDSCNPPWTLDSHGVRVPKRHCFK